jgi:6-phosphogluconolactonase
MTAFSYDAARGELKEVQTLSTLPPGETVKAGFSTAEVVAHPSGRFLFGSNRGHDTIVVFSVDAATGRLTHVENQPTLGKTPRNFAVDPTGAWLLAENQGSGTVAVFRIDAQTGKLTHTGQTLEVPTPVCARFVPAP